MCQEPKEPSTRAAARFAYSWIMKTRPCPTCRKPVSWEGNPYKPFCSERCKLHDLGAWSAETYRVPQNPAEEQDESWGEDPASPGSVH